MPLVSYPWSADHNFIWSNGQTGDSIYVAQSGTYKLEVRDKLGLCPGSFDSTVVTFKSGPNIQPMTDTSICLGSAVFAIPLDSQQYTFKWNGVQGSTRFLPSMDGIQVLEVLNNAGCRYLDTFVVTLYSGPSFSFIPSNPSVCGNDSVLVSLNPSSFPSGYSVRWVTGDSSTAVKLGFGTYYVRITDQLGCMTQKAVTVTKNTLADPDFGTSATGLNVDFFPADLSGTHSWEFGDGGTATNTTQPSHSYSAYGNYTVRHWILTVKGCESSTTKVISVLSGLEGVDNANLRVWPNPAREELHIEFLVPQLTGDPKATLIAADGRKMNVALTVETPRTASLELPSGLSAGTYIVVIETESGLFRKRIQIQP